MNGIRSQRGVASRTFQAQRDSVAYRSLFIHSITYLLGLRGRLSL